MARAHILPRPSPFSSFFFDTFYTGSANEGFGRTDEETQPSDNLQKGFGGTRNVKKNFISPAALRQSKPFCGNEGRER